MDSIEMDSQSNPVIFAYAFDEKGGATPLSGDDVLHIVESPQLAWVHLDVNSPLVGEWLGQTLSFLDPLIVDALLAEETSPRITEINDGALIMLRGVNLNQDAEPDDMISMRLWVDSARIISLRIRKIKAVSEIERRLRAGVGPQNSGEFVCSLVDTLFSRMAPEISSLNDLIDDIEEQVADNVRDSVLESITSLRKRAIVFRRYMAPQRNVIRQLVNSKLVWLSEAEKIQLRESFEQINRFVDDLDAIRERGQVIKDQISSALAEQLNVNMYKLSVIAAVFLPLSFITGLLGINVGGIPGAGNPYAFVGVVIGLVVLLLGEWLLFKRFKWM